MKIEGGYENSTTISHFEKDLFVVLSFVMIEWITSGKKMVDSNTDQTYLQLPLRQWRAGNFYLLVLSSWKVNIDKNHIVVMGW